MSENNMHIEFNYLNVDSCFKNFYVVPDYQREYVWEEKQVDQLLNDIMETFSVHPNKEYFIGSIVVYKNKEGIHELIDGQQRLTTLFLILCAFKRKYTEEEMDSSVLDEMIISKDQDRELNIIEKYRVELQYEDASDYLEYIFKDEQRPNVITKSGERLYSAYENIYSFLNQSFSQLNELKKFIYYIYYLVRFIQIETPNISDALKIFETINERGIGLNPMDLLKNLIFRQVQREEFSELKKEWKKLIDILEKNNEKPLRFLRYVIMANYSVRSERRDNIVREDEIYTWFSKNEDQCRYTLDPFKFVKLLIENAECYVSFINGHDNWGENIYLKNIKRLIGGAFRQHLILLLAARHFDKKLFDHFVKQIEVMLFYSLITNESTRVFERDFSKWANEVKDIKNEQELNHFINEKLQAKVNERLVEFNALFSTLSQNSMQQYRVKYILAKIAQYMEQQKIGIDQDSALDSYFKSGIEIEHILPQMPTEELYRIVPEEIYHEVKYKLGNLTLLEKSINSSIGNSAFYNSKKEEYKKSAHYITKSIVEKDKVGKNTRINKLNEKIKSWDEWNKSTIEERQEVLFNLSREIWKIEII